MESNLSCLSSLKDEDAVVYIQPHYKESYRLAIYALLCGGKEAYEDFLQAEQISHFLSEEEILFILEHAELPEVEEDSGEKKVTDELSPSTYFPTESDEEVPDLDLGWPEVSLEDTDTSISLLFHPPRQNTPTIKEVIRKQIQEARQVIAIAMDVFTDIDIFKEIISATLKGVVVYILLDDSHIKSFLTMSHRVGINIQDLKNLRVRTVQGQQYQCRSGMKFHGGLEQKFILVDCRTVLYGTYSYSWSFEKINLSMVLVVTGQLVCSYDEEFRRLYARSTVPIPSKGNLSVPYLRDTVTLKSPNSSQLSLNHVHMRSRVMHGMRSAQDDRFNNTTMMIRGLSMQERLHQSHYADVGNLVRGHSYGGELQKMNSMTRLRMGTKDIGATPERNGANLRSGGDFLLSNRLSQQHLRHQTRYGADQNLIPFNSETSLHRWKIDTYLNENDMLLDASCDALSPMASPYSSYTGLNEHQSQLIHSRSRDIKSRMEEMRQKRFSLQEYANLRQSQESLRSMYPPLDRLKFKSSLRGLDVQQSMTESEPNAQDNCKLEESDTKKESDKKEQILTDGHRSTSHHNIKTVTDRKTLQTYDWHEPLSRTTSAADLDMKLNDATLKLSIQHQRAMESLTEIPEEKEGSNSRVNSSESAFKDTNGEMCKDEKAVPKENSVKSSLPADPQSQGQARGSNASIRKINNSIGSPAPKEGKKSTSSQIETAPKTSTVSQPAGEAKSNHTEKGQTQQEEPPLQRKNSIRMKVQALLASDDKKAAKKEEKSLQRRASLRSQNTSGSKVDHSQAAAAEQTSKKGQSPSTPKSQRASSGPSETEKHKSPFPRLTPQRSSKRKTNPAAEQDQGSKSTLDSEAVTLYQTSKQKAYSRYEYLLSTENIHLDRSTRMTSTYSSDKDRGSLLNRHDSGYPGYQTQSGTDNKLGRFMQRVGNLIGKNK
ncbi:protein FAM83B-like [Acanthochromis polyacanthus]|uniref:Protein FAM83B-like n=1 Tax=Acanthochromis polyacanthus TaxID=80966 RepID=A0A3Q1GPZ3_9TELE|nr:protein FAM83B-like [Acanthochromis polyacanthus]